MSPKILIPILFAAILLGVWVVNQGPKAKKTTATTTSEVRSDALQGASDQLSAGGMTESAPEVEDVYKPASQRYQSAEQALAAVRKGAIDYDDILIEEFNDLKECDWCEDFYSSLSTMLTDKALGIDERAYYAEILAISGNLDNIKYLATLVESSTAVEEKEMFGEAIEMAGGGDDTVKLLSEFLNSSNSTLRESVVSAISNQGTRLAAETLYNDLTSETGAKTDYYSMGIGLAEMVPDDDAVHYLHELLNKRATKSDQIVKALINSGLEGLTAVFDSLSSETNEALGRELLKDATDHVITEDSVINLLTKASQDERYPQFLKDFANQALKEAQSEDIEEDDEDL